MILGQGWKRELPLQGPAQVVEGAEAKVPRLKLLDSVAVAGWICEVHIGYLVRR